MAQPQSVEAEGMHGSAWSAIGAVRESGYAALVVDRLAQHTCGVVGADTGGVVVRDPRDPTRAFTAAACGVAADRVGERFALRRGVVRDVMATARPQRLGPGPELTELAGGAVGASGAAVPMCWDQDVRGAVWVVATPGDPFEERRIRLLRDMAELTATAIEHAENRERLEIAVEAGVEALAAAIELRDGYTGEHSKDVVDVAAAVGETLGLPPVALVELTCAARLHDVGKIAVPDGVLRKPGPLDEAEWATMRRHPSDGAELLARVPGLEAVAAIVRFHHERWDGGGYPDGIAGPHIPLASRIVAACDAFRAMTADRPYREGVSTEAALDELRAGAGRQFDADVVEALVQVVSSTRARR